MAALTVRYDGGMQAMLISNRAMAIAHTQALKEDAARSVLRDYARDHAELLDAFLLAVATDPLLAMDLAHTASAILKRRQTYAGKAASHVRRDDDYARSASPASP